MASLTESVTGDLQALTGIARATVAVLGEGRMTTGDLRTDVAAMRSILNRIDARLDRQAAGPVPGEEEDDG